MQTTNLHAQTLRAGAAEVQRLAATYRAAARTHPTSAEYWMTLAAGAQSSATCLSDLALETRPATAVAMPAAPDDGDQLYKVVLAAIDASTAARTVSLVDQGRLAADITGKLRSEVQAAAA